MTQPAIYLATITDLPWIRTLWRDMVAESPAPYPTDVVGSIDAFTRSIALALTADPPLAFVFLARLPDSATPDAFFAYEVQHRALGQPAQIAFVHYIYTKPAARRGGLATLLLQIAAEHMVSLGLTHGELTTLPGVTAWEDLGVIPYEVRSYTSLAAVAKTIAARQRRHANGLDRDIDGLDSVGPSEEE